jgi:hypothetical protein
MTSLEVRLECLQIASRTHAGLPDAEVIAKAADIYFRFLTGNWTTKPIVAEKKISRSRKR